MKVLRESDKLLRTIISGEMVFSHWRCAKRDGSNSNFDFTHFIVGDDSIDHAEANLILFLSKIQILVLNKFMKYLLELESESEIESELFERSVFILSRLCSFIDTIVRCFRSDGRDKVGDHRQKLHHDILASFLPNTFDPTLGKIRVFTQLLCPSKTLWST